MASRITLLMNRAKTCFRTGTKVWCLGWVIKLSILFILWAFLPQYLHYFRRNKDTAEPTSTPAHNDFVVPNIVHFVWFKDYTPLKYLNYLSLRSAAKNLRPEKIMFHCSNEPIGYSWKQFKNQTRNLVIKHRDPPQQIFGKEIKRNFHRSGIASIQILREYGGIYLDLDIIALRSFNDLRGFDITLGVEYHGAPGRINNGIILANKNSEFLKMWYNSYKNFTKSEWDYHASIIPYRLMFQYPNQIHIEERTFHYPDGKHLDLIYEKLYDWRKNYAIHLWTEIYDFDHGPATINRKNTTFGQIARYVLYGNTNIRK